MKNWLLILLFLFLGTWIVFAVSNFSIEWKNWDANIIPDINETNQNDNFKLEWRLDLEDSRSTEYTTWYRWKIKWIIKSDLFWNFNISDKISLSFKSQKPDKSKCWNVESLELYKISWRILSQFWWEMNINESSSYFCSNKYLYIKLESDSIWLKEIWNNGVIQWNLVDDFWKQEISISGVSKIKWNTDIWILNRWDWKIGSIWVSVSKKTIANKNINKNVSKLFNSYKQSSKIKNETFLNSFSNLEIENYYLYDYINSNQNVNFEGSWDYKNKWKILQIWNNWNGKIAIAWKQTVIVKSWSIYINSNLYNTNDKNSLLILVAKRWKEGKGWNIYINPNVTNIDAILIADWSLISLLWNDIQEVNNSNQKNNLRKQLLIYGSVFSSNSIWTDEIPYWADYYEDTKYSDNKMVWNIYDLWNLRTFNLNYWKSWTSCVDESKLAPINWEWSYKKYAWAWRKECYNSDVWDSELRKSDKRNPLIIEYNNRIQLINPFILKSN
jgi:hypothetical protein